MSDQSDRIDKIFIGKNIFLTGGTGYVGKVFVEKILRICPEIENIYFLIRSKKGKSPQTRLKELFTKPLFDKLKSLHGNEILEKKCKAIEGDVTEINLGISLKDREFLAEKINYIYHIAATVRFDESLKDALIMNTRGTKFMLDLAKECKCLELFCHVSTAYVAPEEKILMEKIYSPNINPHEVLNLVENLTPEELHAMTPKILGDMPNTYAFTKMLSESLVNEQMENLPIFIVRPSVVIPTWREPIPGWGDNINGPAGLLIAAGKGIARTMYCKGDCYADFLPLDVLANSLCISCWDFITFKKRKIYNLITSDEVQVTWNDIITIGKEVSKEIPFNWVVWYPGGGFKSSKLVHYIHLILLQILPAVFLDIILYCLGYKPILLNIQKRIIKGYELLEFYATNQWLFDKTNIFEVKKNLTQYELKKYYIEKDNLDIKDYFRNAVLGARRYLMKEPDETLEAARRHLRRMWYVDLITKILLVFGVFYLFYRYIYSSLFSSVY